jgi:integrase
MKTNQLSDMKVRRAKLGMHGDGSNLWLQVTGDQDYPARSWIFRYTKNGQQKYMGLGAYPDVGLREAREKAAEARRLLREGKDPLKERQAQRVAAELEAAKDMTFQQCAERYIEAHRAGWKSQKHVGQWEGSLKRYVYPALGKHSIQVIDTGLVLGVIEPVWKTKTETASRLRSRIENVLDWATARGLRKGDNPARWKGHLDHLLPDRDKVQKVEHFAALPYAEIADFMAELRDQAGVGARALEFTILNGVRTNEVTGAVWGEVDLPGKMWVIPAERMKMRKEHRVPLSERAVAILQEMAKLGAAGYIFPGGRAKKSLSGMAMLMLLRRMGRKDITVHGFRSSFRDWAAEQTNYPRDVAEMALAHAIGDKVEAAYRRGELLDKRRRLMAEWAKFCAEVRKPEGNVAVLRSV